MLHKISVALLGLVLVSCSSKSSIGLVDAGMTAGSTGTATSSTGMPGATGSGTTSSGTAGTGTASTGTTGSTTAGLPSCGPNLSCYGDRCMLSNCKGTPHETPCGLVDGGSGLCAGGTCRPNPQQGTDNANCGVFGAACPAGSNCNYGLCALDTGGAVGSCAFASCPLGMQCSNKGPGFVVFCVTTSCSPSQDDQACQLDHGAIGICCGSACVDISTELSNCGGCGIACGAGAICRSSSCLLTSCSGQARGASCALGDGYGTCCGADCIDLRSDPTNCGVCGVSCPVDAGYQCSNGACEHFDDAGRIVYCYPGTCPTGFSCSFQFALCVPDCSVAPDGVVCGSSLVNQFVTANVARICCGHQCVDPGVDPANCGGCGTACDAGLSCDLGSCVQTDCTLSSGDFAPCPLADGGGGMCCSGRCADPFSDELNCGICRHACGDETSCQTGFCLSRGDAGTTSPCGGACPAGTACSPAQGICLPSACGANDTNAFCTFAIDAGALEVGRCCGGACVDPATDPNNCLFCGIACGLGSGCAGGICNEFPATCGVDGGPQCGPGLTCVNEFFCASTSCTGRTNGEACLFGVNAANIAPGTHATLGVCCSENCVDVTQDPQNCGACGVTSPSGLCLAPNGRNQNNCIDDACADLSTDPQHCGSCAIACPEGQTCFAGTCSGSPACGPGRWGALCDPDAGTGTICCPGLGCVDVSSDSRNCGSCGFPCVVGGACRGGVCQ